MAVERLSKPVLGFIFSARTIRAVSPTFSKVCLNSSKSMALDADGSKLVISRLDLLALEENVTDRLVGGASDFKLIERGASGVVLVEDKHSADGRLVGGQSAGLDQQMTESGQWCSS